MTPTARRRVLGIVAAVIVGVGLCVPPAAADEPAAVGWWWAGRPTAAIPALLSPVPPVPEGGLYVAGDVTGPTGISALRFELTPDASANTLTLTIADTAGTPIITACAAAEVWKPAENGVWDQRPDPDCEVSIAGTVNTDETEVSFPLLELPDHGGNLDLVFVPGVDPETERTATFAVAFEPPSPEALVVTEPAADDTGTSAPASAPSGDWKSTHPSPPSVAPSAPSATSPSVEPPAQAESAAPGFQPPTVANGFAGTDDFAYPAVLALPLVLLAGGTYLAWTLTRPVVVRGVPQPSKLASA